jgi:hypothetical protein
MKVSVIFEDGVIVVDKVSCTGFTFSVDPNWRALQWDGQRGWIEVHHGERVWLTDEADVQPYIDMHASWVPPPEPSQPEPSVPYLITRRQCALQLRVMNIITLAEAKAMTKTAEVPAAVAQVFAGMTQEQQDLAEIDFAAVNYYRDNPLLAMMGLTEAELDQFFVAAAQL